MIPDKDNDCLTSCLTEDLRFSGKELAVRIQIHEGTKRGDAIRLIAKALNHLTNEKKSIFEVI